MDPILVAAELAAELTVLQGHKVHPPTSYAAEFQGFLPAKQNKKGENELALHWRSPINPRYCC